MKTPVSPKVTAGFIAGSLASIILPNIGLITPEMLHALGPWGPFVYGTAVAGVSAVAAWFKNDPLRVPDGKHEAGAP